MRTLEKRRVALCTWVIFVSFLLTSFSVQPQEAKAGIPLLPLVAVAGIATVVAANVTIAMNKHCPRWNITENCKSRVVRQIQDGVKQSVQKVPKQQQGFLWASILYVIHQQTPHIPMNKIVESMGKITKFPQAMSYVEFDRALSALLSCKNFFASLSLYVTMVVVGIKRGYSSTNRH